MKKNTNMLVWLSQASIEIIPRRIYNPKPLREISKENNKLDDEQLNREVFKQKTNPYTLPIE